MQETILTLGILLLFLGNYYLIMDFKGDVNKHETDVPSQVHDLYGAWKKKYNKKYDSLEDQYRLEVFHANYKQIEKFNNDGPKSYTLDFTQFMDLTNSEFKQLYLGFKPMKGKDKITRPYVWTVKYSDEVDWVKQGAVTPIKNQGECGSCWAFSATGALEGLGYTSAGQLQSYSEQQLVDCTDSYGNNGCNGGQMESAFKYTQEHGISLEGEYPYRARQSSCKINKGEFKPTGYRSVNQGDCAELETALYNQPISVAVDANNWQLYGEGIFTDCEEDIDHGVLLVGATQQFWRIKNSWSTQWGELGFIRLKKGNTCGICNDASYPTL